uniref:LIM and calponin homology domains 1a n=1 Tax=Gouania willdenowi TaxID=441366 RepID=A0A8C5HAV3_GOUWI
FHCPTPTPSSLPPHQGHCPLFLYSPFNKAVTGKNFADKDFRSALENGILLCELLSAIKPGLVKKINRLPTPIAGLDNLSVFLRGCEELGLKGAQLFDPGDLQDTSIRANLKDSDCNRKLKNVLNTIFWLGKAASGCASYSGPTLNLKEFEALLAQMKIESDDGGESPQKGSVRDSGYDCWDSERSESLSPPQHTRDNSLDSLDSFGSRSQHSSSPDVVNRGNSDGRGSDSEADGKRPDLRKDDMLARRTGSIESKSTIPFNQFLPNRSNMSSYVPAPRRKPHSEEGEQRSVGSCRNWKRSVSMSDMLSEDEVGHLPSMNRYDRMHEQYNSFREDDDHWQDELARWKNRRRSASQELIKKEEERKRIEKRMKEDEKRKSIKTYKEILEEKERREAELCEAYRNAATPEMAALVLQRYALRFTISDATLDSLKLPRSTSAPTEHTSTMDSDMADQQNLPNATTEPEHKKQKEMETETANQREASALLSASAPTLDCVLTTLTDLQNIETPMLNLAKRVNHWVWDPNEERKRLESWQQEQERRLQEQYQKEQEKLKMEWEKAQLEVKEEERKHNEEERRILEETVSPLSPVGWVNQQTEQTSTTSPSTENNTNGGNVPRLHNGQKMPIGNGDQHSSKLHFFQGERVRQIGSFHTSASFTHQVNTALITVTITPHCWKAEGTHCFSLYAHMLLCVCVCVCRCVSGKRLCSGCSQPLGKGAAMIIDTLGLFFHIQCFKCGVCHGQLGDASAGTDVRIRNGLLSCHECYIASRGRGQPTTL